MHAPDLSAPAAPPGDRPFGTTLLRTSLHAGGRVLQIDLDHGRANEMGSAALDDWERITQGVACSDVCAVITTSSRRSPKGTPLFISGADVTERVGWTDAQVKAHVRRQRRVLADLRAIQAFHVAVVHGVALGWGTELLICCDYKLCTPEARFGLPETGLGILPGAGGSSELWALIGPAQALRLGMTGEQIGADEALRIGLVQEQHGDLAAANARAHALAALAATRSPTALAAFKEALLHSIGAPPLDRAEREARAYERCVDSGDAARGRAAFKQIQEGQAPAWGARARS
jgi:enoyl-CoA hydratase/carnithine racemase